MGVAAGRERQIGELLLHRGHHPGVTVAQLMDAVAVKIEVTLARYAGQPTPLRPSIRSRQGWRAPDGESSGYLPPIRPVPLRSGPPTSAPVLAEVDIPFTAGAAAAVQLAVMQITTLRRHAGHRASPCQ